MAMCVGINGFGRIGRTLMRILTEKGVRVAAINDPGMDKRTAAYLLKYDSTYGNYSCPVCPTPNGFQIKDRKIVVWNHEDPAKIPWNNLKVDYVVESSGKFASLEKAEKHNAKHVLITAACADCPTIVVGVNCNDYQTGQKVVAMDTCLINCLAPLAKVINDQFCIKQGLATTVHAATKSQQVLDAASKTDLRLGRSVFNNIIPSASGCGKSLGKLLPPLRGKISGMAVRVPIADVSMLDLTVVLEKDATKDCLKQAIMEASDGPLKGILAWTEDELVSSDLIGTSQSCVFDCKATMCLNANFFKLVAWYDNEYGYCSRVGDLLQKMMETDLAEMMEKEKSKEEVCV